MEYLMTYGWAILIIAVVLGALFGLGFFNSATLAPKVAAGSCQVYRPNGPGTTTFINTEGVCNNELPQYVAQYNTNSLITTSYSSSLNPTTAVTVSAWIWENPSNLGNGYGMGIVGNKVVYWQTFGYQLYEWGGGLYFGIGNSGTFTAISASAVPSKWVNVVGEYDTNGNLRLFFNGQLVANTIVSPYVAITSSSDPFWIGDPEGSSRSVAGQIADVQVYNTSLSANEVTALYQEGIGGSPVLLNNIGGWWQLNGNANDYSGNLNNGVPVNVIYTSSWTSGYSAP